jgi:hypothetical protein
MGEKGRVGTRVGKGEERSYCGSPSVEWTTILHAGKLYAYFNQLMES